MTFYFGEKEGDELMRKINLRDINRHARRWDHPVKGLLKYAQSVKKHGGDILKLPKKDRERYCVSLVGLALKNDSNLDWWTHMPNSDPPDGLVMTLRQEKNGAYMGYMREVEVVEHRDASEKILDVIRSKMAEKTYESNTILVCLALTPAIYDFQKLATMLASIKSSLKHIFVVFTGISLTQGLLSADQIQTTYTMVQLLPVFGQTTLNIRPYLDDFKERYNKGQESRIIENNRLYYGTANPKHVKNNS
ncbi:hypothetical protein A3B19_03105 [Candidatus Giovannonibacteria bacterium RIFCSPLOWO2_01_FULL_46_32]|uniref:Uncharacterized protein n=1 Tax=Candidatus Giovannonibacteria bacterium RIFCSPLOWO2_01_FULL_46_32 TaxID=1798353 RepID=A0A1F5XH03_9BACT|nr:MAG: hypothetical protein A3B19_03105 [Candidatus Giovannonibacteria bacterium RIFCSPLOWO2_01_FULL_46_32]